MSPQGSCKLFQSDIRVTGSVKFTSRTVPAGLLASGKFFAMIHYHYLHMCN